MVTRVCPGRERFIAYVDERQIAKSLIEAEDSEYRPLLPDFFLRGYGWRPSGTRRKLWRARLPHLRQDETLPRVG